MKIKAAAVLLTAALLAAWKPAPAAAAESGVSITINGRAWTSASRAYIEQGTTLVPLNAFTQIKGVSVQWIPEEGVARLWMERGGVFDFKPDSIYAEEFEQSYVLGTPVRKKGDDVYLPLRFIAEMAGAEVEWNQRNGAVAVTMDKQAIASVPGERIRLFPVSEKNGSFEGIRLDWKGKLKSYPWSSPSSVSSPSQLIADDINGDGVREAVVTLNVGRGTGLYLEELHVLETRTFREVPVEDPLTVAESRVKSEIVKSGDKYVISVEAGGRSTTVSRPGAYYGNEDADVLPKLGFGAIVNYEVRNHVLTAILAGGTSIADFAGDVEITYAYKNGRYAAKDVSFIPYEE